MDRLEVSFEAGSQIINQLYGFQNINYDYLEGDKI
jgi:hypothetical protein